MNKELKSILGGLMAAFLIYLAHAFAEANFNMFYWTSGKMLGCIFLMSLAFFWVYLTEEENK